MIETKKCPYCAEEINIAAIKCKHCGEFLETRHKSPENTHSHTTHHTIAKQNWFFAINCGFRNFRA